MTIRRKLLASVTAGIAVLGSMSCQSDNKARNGGSGGKQAGQQLTFDLFLGDKLDIIDYARRTVTADCMSKAGFSQLKQGGIEQYSASSKMLAIDNTRFRGFTSEEQARTAGFGTGQTAEPPMVVSTDPNFDTAQKKCDTTTANALGQDSRSTLDAYTEIGNQLSGELAVWVRTEVPKATEPMLDCLAQKGFPANDRTAGLKAPFNISAFNIAPGKLDGKPFDWQPKKVPGTVEVSPAKPQLRYVPSSQESNFAAAWYQCDQSTGRLQKLLDGAHRTEATAVAKYQDRLAELNPKIEAIARTAAGMVGKA